MNNDDIKSGKPFYPLTTLRNKLVLTSYTVLLASTAGVYLFAMFLTYTDSEFGQYLFRSRVGIIVGLMSALFIGIPVVIAIADAYVRSMEFRIEETEVIVKKGLVNREIKHIPFRTITNVSSRCGVYDRMFGIGTVQIETAGKSGQQTGPEAKIEGIKNYIEVRDIIIEKLRQFRGQYATTTELEPRFITPDTASEVFPETEQEFHRQMLAEMREIRKILQEDYQ
ncbi:MAG: PH domain-containing protein [Candidatus Odinarchaeota archaeon]